MIRPLRTRHRVMTTMLAVLLPVGVMAGLSARVAVPTTSDVPTAFPSVSSPSPSQGGGSLTFGEAPLEGEAFSDGRVVLRPREDLRRPDLLVYWVPAGVEDPATGVLLGRLAGVRETVVALPSGVRDRAGAVLVYSLAHGEVVARAVLPGGDG